MKPDTVGELIVTEEQRFTEGRLTAGNLNLDEIYAWWSTHEDGPGVPPEEFDDRDRNMAVQEFTANLKRAAAASAPGKQHRPRRSKRRGRWQ